MTDIVDLAGVVATDAAVGSIVGDGFFSSSGEGCFAAGGVAAAVEVVVEVVAVVEVEVEGVGAIVVIVTREGDVAIDAGLVAIAAGFTGRAGGLTWTRGDAEVAPGAGRPAGFGAIGTTDAAPAFGGEPREVLGEAVAALFAAGFEADHAS